MEIKKSAKANLENKKLLFTEIGLIIALVVVYIAFDWSTSDKQVSVFEETAEVVEAEEMIPITQETPPPPPTAAPKIPLLSDHVLYYKSHFLQQEFLETFHRHLCSHLL